MKSKEELLQQLVNIAHNEIGVKEEGGNNCGPRIREYQSATWLTPDRWPWCAAFVCWCLREWIKDEEVIKALGIIDSEHWRPRTAGAKDFVNWANQQKLMVFDENVKAKKGDLVVFDFSHIGIVIADQIDSDIFSIDGNVGPKGPNNIRDSEEVDGVWNKKRPYKLTYKYIRLI